MHRLLSMKRVFTVCFVVFMVLFSFSFTAYATGSTETKSGEGQQVIYLASADSQLTDQPVETLSPEDVPEGRPMMSTSNLILPFVLIVIALIAFSSVFRREFKKRLM